MGMTVPSTKSHSHLMASIWLLAVMTRRSSYGALSRRRRWLRYKGIAVMSAQSHSRLMASIWLLAVETIRSSYGLVELIQKLYSHLLRKWQ